MNPKKYRWSRVYESAEEELIDVLRAKNIDATRHAIESYQTHELSVQPTLTHVWGAEGTAIFMVGEQRFSIQPGDVLDIPPQASCVITTGLSHFAWYESHE